MPKFIYAFQAHRAVDEGQALELQTKKIEEEVDEAIKAIQAALPMDYMKEPMFNVNTQRMEACVEVMDVIHACETTLRMMERDWDIDTAQAAYETFMKNKKRGYYRDEDI